MTNSVEQVIAEMERTLEEDIAEGIKEAEAEERNHAPRYNPFFATETDLTHLLIGFHKYEDREKEKPDF
jgi:hypothetical protein